MASNGSLFANLKTHTRSDSPSIRPSAFQIHEWIDFALDRNEVNYLSNLIRVRWNNRFIRRFADAQISSKGCRGRIRLSPLIWSKATETERRETIIHEACHIIAWHLHGTRIKPHGAEWRQAMKNCNVDPEVYHSINLIGINRFQVRECPNSNRCVVSRKDFGKLKKNHLLHCSICGLCVDAKAIEC